MAVAPGLLVLNAMAPPRGSQAGSRSAPRSVVSRRGTASPPPGSSLVGEGSGCVAVGCVAGVSVAVGVNVGPEVAAEVTGGAVGCAVVAGVVAGGDVGPAVGASTVSSVEHPTAKNAARTVKTMHIRNFMSPLYGGEISASTTGFRPVHPRWRLYLTNACPSTP